MTITIIQERLKSYSSKSKQEEINAIKEIYQEIALAGLARSDFFKQAAFQGGTALRVVHQLRRFSEDLDFVLLKPQKFTWVPFLKAIELEFASFGVDLQIKERHQAQGAIKTAFLKEDSFARILELTYDRLPSDGQKIMIKLEIDTHPPEGSDFETAYLTYPYPFSILLQDLPSLFATKCHAILCRKYEKGRDWFDFLWYLSKNTPINALLLKNALQQAGPYQNQVPPYRNNWLRAEFEKKIASLDWQRTRRDVEAFLYSEDRKFVENWNSQLFQSQIKKMNAVLFQSVIFRTAHGSPPALNSKLFSSAITDLTMEDIEKIRSSDTYWHQSLKEIELLDDAKEYESIFMRFDDPGHMKHCSFRMRADRNLTLDAVPGKIYTLPGWFIKHWNFRQQIFTNNIRRALFWFQPTDLIPKDIQKKMISYAQETGIERHTTL
ncbi:MAG: nucleotidyl transferase AbiEii/AbiGii toxin family protein [Verrucomicrobiota bacterium]|nr:nucleotidyl transferase AbiEii/AbiGii toxin family protein [Verrucomicrobiota bacterium]